MFQNFLVAIAAWLVGFYVYALLGKQQSFLLQFSSFVLFDYCVDILAYFPPLGKHYIRLLQLHSVVASNIVPNL